MRVTFLFSFLIFSFVASRAQSVTGSWYGVADPTSAGSNKNNYLTELVIKQKGNDVEGIFGYYFRDGYLSYYIRGKYNPSTRMVTFKNIPITYFRSRNIEGVDCPMNFSAVLLVSKVKSTLKGNFTSHENYKYTCPELKVNFALDPSDKKQDSVLKHHAATARIKKYWKPGKEELVINTRDSVQATVVVKEVPPPAQDPKQPATEAEKKEALEKLITSFEKRKNIVSKEVEIESDSIRVSFYDNGDIDGDSISVFLNKVPILTHQLLSEKAFNIYLALDDAHPENEISMFAENLGSIPPNTALMVITDGETRHEVFLSSSLTQNASVILKRKVSKDRTKQ